MNEGLTSIQQKAIVLLISGKNKAQVAQEVGVTRETVSRWSRLDPQFMATYNQQMRDLVDSEIKEVLNLRRKAFDKIGELMDSDDEAIALKAATTIVKTKVGDFRLLPTAREEEDADFLTQQINNAATMRRSMLMLPAKPQ